jgi:hypothetical protein
MSVLTGLDYGEQDTLQHIDLTNANTELFAERASILLNTAIQTFMALIGFAAGLSSSNLSLHGLRHVPARGPLATANVSFWNRPSADLTLPPSLSNSNIPFIGASTNATINQYIEVYRPDYAWVTALSVSLFALFLAGLLVLCLNLRIRAAKVFDPVMSLTYNNAYIEIPAHGVPTDAANRAKALVDIKVRLGDVNSNNAVGKITLGVAKNAKPLVKG